MLEDKLTRGYIAGFIGGIAMNIVDHLSFALDISELRLLEWAAVFIHGHKTVNIIQVVFAQFAQLAFSGFGGIIFVFFIEQVTDNNHLFKGWLYGAFLWFAVHGIIVLYKINELIPIEEGTGLTYLVAASVYGLILILSLQWLNKKVEDD